MVCYIFSKIWKIKTFSYIRSIPEYILIFALIKTNNSTMRNNFFGICIISDDDKLNIFPKIIFFTELLLY